MLVLAQGMDAMRDTTAFLRLVQPRLYQRPRPRPESGQRAVRERAREQRCVFLALDIGKATILMVIVLGHGQTLGPDGLGGERKQDKRKQN